jgi:hypothetical protein
MTQDMRIELNDGYGSYLTDERSTCACGRRCEAAAETRCFFCQDAARAAARKEDRERKQAWSQRERAWHGGR